MNQTCAVCLFAIAMLSCPWPSSTAAIAVSVDPTSQIVDDLKCRQLLGDDLAHKCSISGDDICCCTQGGGNICIDFERRRRCDVLSTKCYVNNLLGCCQEVSCGSRML
ncbi:hypothetical protein KP79_PYT03355 [Mizuhopecten yessoensis]|uniref:Uncharacterized protein n=1 Tax=Mizuhopecten yessoensis TaxID=6573 RepID=A0A210PDE7_MIZYE|nr:hypothetical protein KP79_PYT03355 [Mizuhopecten yessoensis]